MCYNESTKREEITKMKAIYEVTWESEDGNYRNEILVATETEAKELVAKHNRPWTNSYGISGNTATYREIKLYDLKSTYIY